MERELLQVQREHLWRLFERQGSRSFHLRARAMGFANRAEAGGGIHYFLPGGGEMYDAFYPAATLPPVFQDFSDKSSKMDV